MLTTAMRKHHRTGFRFPVAFKRGVAFKSGVALKRDFGLKNRVGLESRIAEYTRKIVSQAWIIRFANVHNFFRERWFVSQTYNHSILDYS